MQITVTIPETLLAKIDAAADRMGMSRSAFIRFRVAGETGLAPLPDAPVPVPAAPVVEAEPTRARGHADAPPAGYVLVTIESQDIGKDGWMSPSDAGIG